MSGCPFRNAIENAKAAHQSKNNNNNIEPPSLPNGSANGSPDIIKTTTASTQTGQGKLGHAMSDNFLGQIHHRKGTASSASLGNEMTGSSSSRKTSNMSTCSMGSDETDGEKKLDLVGLIESVGTLLLPSTGFINRSFQNVIRSKEEEIMESVRNLPNFDELTFVTSYLDPDFRHSAINETLLLGMADVAATTLDINQDTFLRMLGNEYVQLCLSEYGRALGMMGSNMVEFFSNLDGLHDHIRTSPKFDSQVPPSFRCSHALKGCVDLHFYSDLRNLLGFYAGIVQSVARLMFSVDAEVSLQVSEKASKTHHVFNIKPREYSNKNECTFSTFRASTSDNPSDLKIGVDTFCSTFPFHVIFDRDLKITQLGTALLKMIAPGFATKGQQFDTYFVIQSPKLEEMTFSKLLSRVNFSFVLETKSQQRGGHQLAQETLLKGQMIYLQESDAILFLGSPSIEKLDEMIAKGLYISDVPIHDATRDVILVGEQTKAQASLKKRMEELKNGIIEGTKAVEHEKAKNIELLEMIFPANIAERLWRGETIDPMKIDDVTMLFSDIVGFTAICSSCTPMEVISMLNSLYTQFDYFCGVVDVYKVETIGDAYCVAGGLHKRSRRHAHQISFMALRMMAIAAKERSKDGNAIRMRIGLHTGSVLAGVVGVRMPRYCLFGNNVTLANKFESGSVAERINISPTTYTCISEIEGYSYTPRTRENLPDGFPEDIEGTCYFLDDFKFPGANKEDPDVDHIALQMEEFRRKDVVFT
ncbi:guanylate cyclase soluble subunit alpha-2-like [Mizuhopecten yessoensis]|uniref:guanylate cyclase n=1 Tax=Mizuhopecten yessoensis TaxID=6573 RepID=A0A210QJM5_MIZYE|nr:guanylate cyclase soluble subunit alpha-2-like [Mizuhopecten yessoensis]OWF48958.1 Guanylate cyclase soluble subunit alpha-2 [Mizuhopecten yessoensis]